MFNIYYITITHIRTNTHFLIYIYIYTSQCRGEILLDKDGAGPIWVMVISRNLLLKFWNLYIYHRGITVSWHPPQGLVWIGAEVPDARPWAQDVPSASHPAPSGRVPQARSELSRRHLGRKRRISRRESGRGDGVPIGNSLELLKEAFFWPIQRLNSGQTLEWI